MSPACRSLRRQNLGSNMHFLGHYYADFRRKRFAPTQKHTALTLAGMKPYCQGAAAWEGFASSSHLETHWRGFSGSKKASKKIKNMPPSHEIEVKFRITDLSALTSRLKSEKFALVTPRTHEMNTLYDLPDSGLRGRGALLRLRQYGDRWTVTYKDRPAVQGRHKIRREFETVVENGPALAQILGGLGLPASL